MNLIRENAPFIVIGVAGGLAWALIAFYGFRKRSGR